MKSNISLPPIPIWINNSYIYKDKEGTSEGILIGVRSQLNKSLQFTVLLRSGALFTGVPVHMLSFTPEAHKRPLNEVLMWDNISSYIELVTFDTLRLMPCTVKLTNGEIISGTYQFTIDYVGLDDLSYNAEHWKMVHVIKADSGEMLVYPQYRIKFTDKGLCDEDSPLPNKHNDVTWTVGS